MNHLTVRSLGRFRSGNTKTSLLPYHEALACCGGRSFPQPPPRLLHAFTNERMLLGQLSLKLPLWLPHDHLVQIRPLYAGWFQDDFAICLAVYSRWSKHCIFTHSWNRGLIDDLLLLGWRNLSCWLPCCCGAVAMIHSSCCIKSWGSQLPPKKTLK